MSGKSICVVDSYCKITTDKKKDFFELREGSVLKILPSLNRISKKDKAEFIEKFINAPRGRTITWEHSDGSFLPTERYGEPPWVEEVLKHASKGFMPIDSNENFKQQIYGGFDPAKEGGDESAINVIVKQRIHESQFVKLNLETSDATKQWMEMLCKFSAESLDALGIPPARIEINNLK